jgi:hypothetical protein
MIEIIGCHQKVRYKRTVEAHFQPVSTGFVLIAGRFNALRHKASNSPDRQNARSVVRWVVVGWGDVGFDLSGSWDYTMCG